MAKFTFSSKKPNTTTSEIKKETPVKSVESIKKNIRVNLIHHEGRDYSPEFYSYVNSNGDNVKYSGLVVTDLDGSYIGKVITTHKVILKYHPAVESVEPVDEYFSYIDKYGKERIFVGEPKFDLEANTYFGEVTEDILHDEIVTIYKEK